MGMKVVIIGGGSYQWTPKLAADLFLRQGLNGSHLSLVDIDEEASAIMKKYCELMVKKTDSRWNITVDDIETALKGADVVCVSISTGGLKAMHNDYHIPEKYGILHCVGDTVGPGGISRTLRNVPVFIDIARKMEKLCPNAWMVHVTNPLSQLTRAVAKETSIKVVGLCHNYYWTRGILARYMGVESEEIDAISVGVNHFTILKNITSKGKNIEDQLSLKSHIERKMKADGEVLSNTTDDIINSYLGSKKNIEHYLNFEMFDQFGYMPTGGSNHVVENFPYYCGSEDVLAKHLVTRKGVFPKRQEMRDSLKQKAIEIIEGREELPELKLSFEGLSVVCESLYTGKTGKCVVAMPNDGQVSNLPKDTIVETWAMITSNGVFPVVSGEVPKPYVGYMNAIVEEEELAVEAALEGSRKKLYQAMWVSPMVQNKDSIVPMCEELLEANREYLPQFFNK